MKKIICTILLIAFAFTTSFAQRSNISITNNNGVINVSIQDSKQKLNLKTKGEVRFTEDDKGIKSLSPDGNISYKKARNKLKISPEKDGSLLYVINGTKKSIPNAKDETLIEECVQLMINMGINAEERVEKIYSTTGFEGVLKEVERLQTEYVKSIYLTILGSKNSLSEGERIAFLNTVDSQLPSSYYKTELLNSTQVDYLNQEVTADAYLKTVRNVKSDYYQTAMLERILQQSLTEKQSEQVLAIINSMESDYYKTEIIKKLLNQSSISDNQFEQYVNMTTYVKSDYYQSEILTSLLKNTSFDEKRYSIIIAGIQNIKSSYYQTAVLQSLINDKEKDEKEWNQLIAYTAKIESDYYKAEVLKKIATTMPETEALQMEFMKAAKTIDSHYYYESVIRATRD